MTDFVCAVNVTNNEREMDQFVSSENTNNASDPEPPQPTPTATHFNPNDPGDDMLYSEIDDTEISSPDSGTPPVYQVGSSGHYEGLRAVSADLEHPRPPDQPLSVYDKLNPRVLSDCQVETLVKVPDTKRVNGVPTRRFPNTI